MTRSELKKAGYTLHHDAYTRGYVSRKSDIGSLKATPYNGKFGDGYTVKLPTWRSTNYCIIEYWTK